MREGGCFTEVTTLKKESKHITRSEISKSLIIQLTSALAAIHKPESSSTKKVAHEAQQNITGVIMF